jgi:hypothetical protein
MMDAIKKVVQKSPERIHSKAVGWLSEVSGNKPSHKLLSVLSGFWETPNNVFA